MFACLKELMFDDLVILKSEASNLTTYWIIIIGLYY
jgi:hypothetical protein